MPRLWLDTETYSETPISAGTHQYVDAGKGAEIMLFASDVWASNPPVLYVECAGVQYAVPSALTNEPPKMQVISEALLVI